MKNTFKAILFVLIVLSVPAFCALNANEKESEIKKAYTIISEVEPALSGFPVAAQGEEREKLHSEYLGAIKILKRVEQDFPKDYEVLFGLGKLYYFGYNLSTGEAGQLCEAYLKQALKIKPNDNDANFYLGSLYRGTGRHSSAFIYLYRAIKSEPNKQRAADIYYQLGNACAAVGDFSGGYYYMNQILKDFPDNESVIMFKEMCKARMLNTNPALIIDADEGDIKYKNNYFKYQCEFPLDWDVQLDTFDWAGLYENRPDHFLALDMPAITYDGKDHVNSILIYSVVTESELDEFAKEKMGVESLGYTNIQEVRDAFVGDSKQFKYNMVINNATVEAEAVFIKRGDIGYMISYAADPIAYQDKRGDYERFVKKFKATEK